MTSLTPLVRRTPPWLRSYGRARRSYEAVLAHPDGRRLIAAELDGTVTVWDRADLRLPGMLSAWELEEARGVHLRLHPDGVRLFVTVWIIDCSDVTMCWNLERGDLIDRYEYPRVPHAFVGDDRAVTAHGLYLTLWDLESGDTVRQLERDDRSWALVGTIGEHALTGGRGPVELWHVPSGRVRWTAPAAEARGVAVAADLAVLAAPGRITLRAADGRDVRQLACPALGEGDSDWMIRIDRAATTAVIAGATEDLVAIDLATGAIRSRFPRPGKWIELAIAATDRDVLVWSDVERAAAVWSLATGACRLRAPSELVLACDGETAITVEGPHLRLWPVDGRDLAAGSQSEWTTIATALDAVVAFDRARRVHVLERSGATRHTWGLAAAGFPVFAHDRVACLEGSTVAIFDASTGARVQTITPTPAPASIGLSPDGRVVAVAGQTDDVQLFSTVDEQLGVLASFRTRERNPEIIALDADARRLAIRCDTTIELWRAFPPLRQHTFRSRTRPSCAAFDPSDPAGRWLVTGHADGALLVRDTLARTHHATLEPDGDDMVRSIAVRRGLVAACSNGAVALWDLATAGRLATWSDDNDVLDVAWLDDDTLACATEGGLVLLRCDHPAR